MSASSRAKHAPNSARAGGASPIKNESEFYASQLRGASITGPAGSVVGRLRDVVIKVDEAGDPAVVGLVIRVGRHDDHRVPWESTSKFSQDGAIIAVDGADQPVFERCDGEMLVIEDILDAEVVDRDSVRVIRVNDARIAVDGGAAAVVGIDASAAGLGRRLAPRRLARWFEGVVLPWSRIEPMVDAVPDVDFRLRHTGFGTLHPSDIAKLIAHLPYRQGGKILCALEDDAAADTLEEVEKHRQPEILEYLPEGRAAAILNRMAPDAAADLLQVVPRDVSDKLLSLLNAEVSADIRLLLSYPHDSAAGLMTTDFIMALEGETAREALEYVRAQLRKPDLIYYVYIVDHADARQLRGVISLRDLLLADPDQSLGKFMRGVTRTVHPEEHSKEVARIMGEYNLLALPVVDESGRMLGLVTADDVLDLMLPESMRQHLPRLFS